MAVPTSQTATLIVTEALLKAGGSTPSATQITRATDYWLEEVKQEIAQKKDWKLFEDTKVLIPDAYVHRITDPTDFHKMLDVRLYSGGTKGTMQAATSSNITLASGTGNNSHLGRLVFITSGNAKAEMSRIVSMTGDVAGISPNWGTTPSSGNYMIADSERTLRYLPHEEMRAVASTGWPSRITYFDSEFSLDAIPDVATFAIVLKFLITIEQLDLTDARYTVLLNKWRTALVQGVYVKALQDRKDVAYLEAWQVFKEMRRELMIQDSRQRRTRSQSYVRPIGGLPR